MYKQVLVPLDASPLAESVLPHAKALAERFGANVVFLQVIHTFDDLRRQIVEADDDAIRKQQTAERDAAVSYLTRVAEPFEAAGLNVQLLVREGLPGRVIRAVATETGTDLIAMATHSHRGLVRSVLGSVTEDVVRLSHLPVLVVGPVEE